MASKEEAEAMRKQVGDLEAKLEKMMVEKDKVLKELDAKIDAETLKLRELRYKMVDAGVYKSWYQAVLKES